MKVGIIGFSEGNGHPFSFSSIINGYSNEGYEKSGWTVIHNYLKAKPADLFGIKDVKVTHAYTQDIELTKKICEASKIENVLDSLETMKHQVDAVILARDDYETHLAIAKPFLLHGLPVFIDKPLSLNKEEMKFYRPYLENAKLMSCSGMRYASELQDVRAGISGFGQIKLVRSFVINEWEKYGVHLLDAFLGLGTQLQPISVEVIEGLVPTYQIELNNGGIMTIDCLGKCPKVFRMEIFGSEKIASCEISDNFLMFRKTLVEFFNSIESGKPAFPVEQCLTSIKILMAGKIARAEKRKVDISEINLG